MAQHVEPMDIDMENEFDNKENSYQHGNVLPCTEKGYEELDVSELNMKLRYSVTPAASPMSKSYTAYVDNRNLDTDDSLNHNNYENTNLTRSLNSTMTNDSIIKSLKSLPLQTISTEQVVDNRSSVLRQLDSTVTCVDKNVMVTISGPADNDENLSLPSSSSSAAHTPEATTPTNITKNEEGSPIIRGLKSVFNMFRSSPSPVPPEEHDHTTKLGNGSLDETYCEELQTPTLASTPLAAHRNKDSSSTKRSSPLKDSITFKEDLEKEIQWKEDTILFSEEKIPIHKLLLPLSKPTTTPHKEQKIKENLNLTVEYMDVSYNNSMALDNTITETATGVESDAEFVDCETTFTKNESQNTEINLDVENTIKETVTEIESKINKARNVESIENEAIKQLESSTSYRLQDTILKNDNTAINNEETKKDTPTSETNLKLEVIRDDFNDATTLNKHETKLQTEKLNARTNENNSNIIESQTDSANAKQNAITTKKDLSIEDCDKSGGFINVADSTEVNVTTPSNSINTLGDDLLNEDLNTSLQNQHDNRTGTMLTESGNISSENFSQTFEDDTDATNITTDDIDRMIMILQQYERKETDEDTDKNAPEKSVRPDEILEIIEPQEKNNESIVPNQNEKPVNIPLPDHVSLKPFKEIVDASETLTDVIDINALNITQNNNKIDNYEQLEGNALSGIVDMLNETHDIVNSLTEIIGESPNNTVCLVDQSVEQMQCIQQSNKTLPDLINQTVKDTTIEWETKPSLTIVVKSEEVVEIPETFSNIEEKQTPERATLNTSETKNSTAQSREPINTNEYNTKDLIPKEPEPKEDVTNKLFKEDEITTDKLKTINEAPIDDEIIISENNSPYVSVIAESEVKPAEENFEKIDIPVCTNEAPPSPPIRSKGYNFNFDEMDDPFATKTNIRKSPTPTTKTEHKKGTTNVKPVPNRRRSQPPERKRPTKNKNKFNTTVDAAPANIFPENRPNDQFSEGDSKHLIAIKNSTSDSMEINVTENKAVSKVLDFTKVMDITVEENLNVSSEKEQEKVNDDDNVPPADITIEKSSELKSEPDTMTEIKPSTSEHLTYYTDGSSSDTSVSKNVFNLPEIHDNTFNPFATKSKMRQSPPPVDSKTETPLATQNKVKSSLDSTIVVLSNVENTLHSPQIEKKKLCEEDKMDIELMEKDASYNSSNLTSSFKNTDDKTREVNTEDEDTEEGPFLETEDVIENFLDIDDNNMMQFNEVPTQASEENADGGELFIDAEAFEFLLNQNKCSAVADSGKESLFLKFDPLFAKRMSSGGDILAALSQVQKRQSTPTKPIRPSLRNEASPIAGPSNLSTTDDAETNTTQDSIEDLNITVAKPMMVVTPAVNAAVTPRNKTTTPPRSNRRSINFTSPAMAVIDRLLSLSGNNSLMGYDTAVSQRNREHTEADLALTQLRELLAEKEFSVYELRNESKELKDRLSTMESQVKILESDGQDRLNKINELNDRLAEKTKVNKSMAAVVEEYERTIASLIAETEQDKKSHAEERMRLISERDEQTAHLASMEVSFSDLHSKYEKSKQVILSCKANEETCKKSIRDFEENLAKMQTNYEALKQHATSKLNQANQELQKITKAHESEVLKLNALIKRKDMHITSLEETLAQKTKANEELTAICDELINKVG